MCSVCRGLFCCGFTFFYPHRRGSVCGEGSSDFFPFLQVDFFSTRVMGGVVALGEDMIRGFREVKEVRGVVAVIVF